MVLSQCCDKSDKLIMNRKKCFAHIIWLLIIILSRWDYAEAKRLAPRDVEPIIHNGVKYAAPHWAAFNSYMDHNGGYIEAWDVKTGAKLWHLEIYHVEYNPHLEGDVQDVFITSLSIQDEKLVVVNERNEVFKIDLNTKNVLKDSAVKQESKKVTFGGMLSMVLLIGLSVFLIAIIYFPIIYFLWRGRKSC